MKTLSRGALLLGCCVYCFASYALGIESVSAKQRYPWNGLVDIHVELSGSASELSLCRISFMATNGATQAALTVATISDANDTDVITRRHFVWDAKQDVGAVKIDDVAFTVEVSPPGVQLWEGGPYWAECNVGATKPEEAGYYFWWGDTVGYKRVGSQWNAVDGSRKGYTFSGESSEVCLTWGLNNAALRSKGYITNVGVLAEKYDAAKKYLGRAWRMPTVDEFAAMTNKCTTSWVTINGVDGRLVTGKGMYSAKTLFLPAGGRGYNTAHQFPLTHGFYWTSSPSSSDSDKAYYLGFHATTFNVNTDYRSCGRLVRPVVVAELANSAIEECRFSFDACDEHGVADSLSLTVDPAWGGATSGYVTCNGEEIAAVNEAGTVGWTAPEVLERTEFVLRFVAGSVDYSTTFRKEATTRQMAYVEAMVDGFAKDIALVGNADCVSVSDGVVKLDGAVIGDNSETVLSFVTTRDGKFRFEWVVDSEPNDSDADWYDYGWWRMDDGEVQRMAGINNEWQNEEIVITDGAEHLFRFGYLKDGDSALGEDCLKIRNVEFVGEASLTVVNGWGSGNYYVGDAVTVTADAAEYGAWFAGWTGDVACLADAASRETVLTVPERDVTVTATYADRATGMEVANVLQEAFQLGAGVASVAGAADAVVLTNGVVAIGGIDTDGMSILGDGQTASFSVTTQGKGTLSFAWLVSSEGDGDLGQVLLNGEEIAQKSGKKKEWVSVTQEADAREGGNVWTFSYTKNAVGRIGDDVVMVRNLRWTPAPSDPVVEYRNENGVRKSLTVERAWLTDAKRTAYLSGVMGLDVATAPAEELAAKLTLTGANGVPLWQSFVAGLEPAEAGSRFTVALVPGENGNFTLQPNPPPQEGRKYTVRGTDELTKPESIWPEAELGDEKFVETNRFFKVRVEMK